jgi:hypothetical protein
MAPIIVALPARVDDEANASHSSLLLFLFQYWNEKNDKGHIADYLGRDKTYSM